MCDGGDGVRVSPTVPAVIKLIHGRCHIHTHWVRCHRYYALDHGSDGCQLSLRYVMYHGSDRCQLSLHYVVYNGSDRCQLSLQYMMYHGSDRCQLSIHCITVVIGVSCHSAM